MESNNAMNSSVGEIKNIYIESWSALFFVFYTTSKVKYIHYRGKKKKHIQ